ncbi:MAG: hypothetical protein ACRDFZ_04615 [Candidatus Limnocylindria bacterium]
MCGSPLTFGAEALLGPLGAETADHPAAEALRTFIANSPVPTSDSPLPTRPGWRVVVLSEESALFLQPALADEEHAYWSAEFEYVDSSWKWARSGQCDVKPWFDGLETARWEMAPAEQPSPESRTVAVLVSEQTCPNGESLKGPIEQAAVTYLEDSVIVVLGNRIPPGPHVGCGPLAPAAFLVELSEPVGDRQLLDGYVYPPEPRDGG